MRTAPRRRRATAGRAGDDPLPGLPIAPRRQEPLLSRLRILFFSGRARRGRRPFPRPPARRPTARSLRDRAKVGERRGVERFRGVDCAAEPPVPVWIIRQPLPRGDRGARPRFAVGRTLTAAWPTTKSCRASTTSRPPESMATADPAGPARLAEHRLGEGPACTRWTIPLCRASSPPSLKATLNISLRNAGGPRPVGRLGRSRIPLREALRLAGAGRGGAAHAPFVQRRPRRHPARHYRRRAGRPGAAHGLGRSAAAAAARRRCRCAARSTPRRN